MRDCDLISEFVDFIRYGKHRAERTIAGYKNDIEQFVDFLALSCPAEGEDFVSSSHRNLQACRPEKASVMLPSVTAEQVKGYMNNLQSNGYSSPSVRRKLASLICFYHFLFSKSLISSNPIDNIHIPQTQKHEPKILTEEQLWQLLHFPSLDNWLSARDRAILELLCNSGIRVSELVKLNNSDIDLGKLSLRILDKQNKERRLQLLPATFDAMRYYTKLKQDQFCSCDENALFVNKFGKRLDTRSVDRRIEKYLKQAGLNKLISPYDLRHTFAVRLINKGASVDQLCQLLGFESKNTAKIYADSIKNIPEKQKVFFE